MDIRYLGHYGLHPEANVILFTVLLKLPYCSHEHTYNLNTTVEAIIMCFTKVQHSLPCPEKKLWAEKVKITLKLTSHNVTPCSESVFPSAMLASSC